MNANETIKRYIELRDFISAKETAFKEALKPFKDEQAKIEQTMLDMLLQSGSDSIRTPDGTAYKSEKVSVTCADKAAFMDYIKDNAAFELLDVRPNKTAVQDYMAENQDTPPGVNVRRELTCNFRRS